MLELTEKSALSYLHATQRLPPSIEARVLLLEWEVSNVVLRVEPDGQPDLVIKQSRQQLRTRDPWFSRLDRIFREVDIMRIVAPLLPAGVVPNVLFEDRDNYLFAMEAIPADHVVWKQALLQGRVDPSIADRLGTYLATVHRETANRRDLARLVGIEKFSFNSGSTRSIAGWLRRIRSWSPTCPG